MYLLDTVVLSELRKARRQDSVVRWLAARRPAELFISVITLGEIERGIAKQQKANPQFARKLAEWLDRTTAPTRTASFR
jgi:predicted nucleic acid-binding protein